MTGAYNTYGIQGNVDESVSTQPQATASADTHIAYRTRIYETPITGGQVIVDIPSPVVGGISASDAEYLIDWFGLIVRQLQRILVRDRAAIHPVVNPASEKEA